MIAPNLRKTLYIKDDDYRLSFLFGNFITLTNLTEKDFKRIKNYHLSPLFVSIHTMNPDLRAKMLRTPLAAKIQTQLDNLERAGAQYHTQIVLCRDLNDDLELNYTISELLKRRPYVLSLAIVPVGVTKYRKDKFPLKQFDKKSAEKVISQVETFQKKIRAETGKTFIYLGDEFYFLAEKEFPPLEFYDDFPQIENGIGMTRNFIEEIGNLELEIYKNIKIKIDVVSGTSFAKILKKMTKNMPNVRVLPVENKFFGNKVNVSGLLTGGDIINELKNASGDRDLILIPATALKSGEEIFLDDISLEKMRKIFNPAKIIPIHDGFEFKKALKGEM